MRPTTYDRVISVSPISCDLSCGDEAEVIQMSTHFKLLPKTIEHIVEKQIEEAIK